LRTVPLSLDHIRVTFNSGDLLSPGDIYIRAQIPCILNTIQDTGYRIQDITIYTTGYRIHGVKMNTGVVLFILASLLAHSQVSY